MIGLHNGLPGSILKNETYASFSIGLFTFLEEFMDFNFYMQSILFGFGLAADASAVSMANGLEENKMKPHKMLLTAFMFAFFQAVMPLIGYFVGHAFIDYIEPFIPWIALILLGFLGIKMIIDGIKKKEDKEKIKKLTIKTIFIQAIATSIDALSVGLTFSNYSNLEAVICCLIIAIVTFILSLICIIIGKKFGTKFENKAVIIGGIILIIIGFEIFISSFIG